MQKPMDRYQVRISSFDKALKNNFEVWLLEERIFKDEKHTLIDARSRNIADNPSSLNGVLESSNLGLGVLILNNDLNRGSRLIKFLKIPKTPLINRTNDFMKDR